MLSILNSKLSRMITEVVEEYRGEFLSISHVCMRSKINFIECIEIPLNKDYPLTINSRPRRIIRLDCFCVIADFEISLPTLVDWDLEKKPLQDIENYKHRVGKRDTNLPKKGGN